MTNQDIEHMWKVATNNPHHDTNWHDPAVVKFAQLVAAHTLMNTDPSRFMSHQEGIEAGRLAEREACVKVCERHAKVYSALSKTLTTDIAWAASPSAYS